MRCCLVLAGLVLVVTAHARDLEAAAAPRLPAAQDLKVAELERSLEFVYAEVEALRRDEAPSTAGILAAGAGAGVGFVLGSLAGGALVIPAVAGAATTAGMSSGWADVLAAGFNTITSVAFTLGGGSVGDALVD